MADARLSDVLRRAEDVDPVREAQAMAAVKTALVGPGDAVAISRYRILERLGEGGMGIVYKAYDPELDRAVAIKLLRSRARGRSSDTTKHLHSLMREARTIARLCHPNVVSVYDVGTTTLGTTEDVVFVVMEFVDGPSLETWLQSAPRSTSEVLEVFAAAARGVAAAHREGLVHRDFKPANVLLGANGRVRVADFGLALAAPRHPTGRMRAELRVGTPLYMAPEQHAGWEVDAAADQYAFCVSLWEALHGSPPFVAEDLEALLAQKLEGAPPAPAVSKVPRRLHPVLVRGMSADAAERYPNMDELLEALLPSTRRRWWIAAVGAGVGLGAAGMAMWTPDEAASVSAVCRDEAPLREVWDDEARTAAEAAFARVGPDARRTWPKVRARLDAHVGRWLETRAEACERTWVEGNQSAERFTAQMACFEQRRDGIATLSRLLRDADATIADRAVDTIAELAAPEACLEVDTVATPGLSEEERRHVQGVERSVYRAHVYFNSGRAQQATEVARAALARARRAGVPLAIAKAQIVLAYLFERRRDMPSALEHCEAAFHAAERAGDPNMALYTLIRLIPLTASVGDVERAAFLVELGRSKLEGVGGGPRVRAELAMASALVGATRIRNGEALDPEAVFARYVEAREVYARLEVWPMVGHILHLEARFAYERGLAARALSYQREAVRVLSTAFEAEHPDLGSALNNLAAYLVDAGGYEGALAAAERAARIKSLAYGDDALSTSSSLHLSGEILSKLGRHEEAVDRLKRVLAVQVRQGALEAELTAHRMLGTALRRAGRMDEALEHLEIAFEGEREADVRAQVGRIESGLELVDALLEMGRVEQARALLEALRPAPSLSAASPALACWVAGLSGMVDARAGEVRSARSNLEHASTCFERVEGSLVESARVRFALAELQARAGERERAALAARRALLELAPVARWEGDLVARIEALLEQVESRAVSLGGTRRSVR